MQKWGRHRNGKVRYYCSHCACSSTKHRTDISRQKYFRLFIQWLLGNQSLQEIAVISGISRMTLYRHFLEFKKVSSYRHSVTSINKVIIIDGTFLTPSIVVLVARTTTQIINWRFYTGENFITWKDFLTTLLRPKAVVCDGQKGMLKALRLLWEGIIIQRCLFHIQSRCLTKLTQHPQLLPNQQLRLICLKICHLETLEARNSWLREYRQWKLDNQRFIYHKTLHFNPIIEDIYYTYAHRSTRTVIYLIDHALPNMFEYLYDSDIPRTSNYLEGGTNARLKELIHRHRGLTLKGQIILADHYLRKQQKPTQNVT